MARLDLIAFVDFIKERIIAIRCLTAEKLEGLLGSKIAGRDASELAVYVMILVYTLSFSYFTILKHYAFRSFAWDLGIINQALWTTVKNGRLLYYTPELFFNSSGCYLGLHFSPILFLLLPVYAVYQGPETLLVLQSFIIALGTLPFYLFTRKKLNSRLAAVSFSLFYLLYPPLHGANWFDFHVQSFLPLFFFSTMYYLENEKWSRYFIFLVLALSIAENVSLVVLFIGLYGIMKYKNHLFNFFKLRKLNDKRILVPLATIILAVTWILIARWVQSTFFPLNPNFHSFYRATDYWSVLGIEGDPITMPFYIILNPLKTLQALTYDAYLKMLFIFLIFGSLLFLPLKNSISVIALSFLGPALLSNIQKFYVIGTHYPLYYIPFLFLAAVLGMKKQYSILTLSKIKGQLKGLMFIMLGFSLFASPLSPLLLTSETIIPHFSEYRLQSIGRHEIALQEFIALIPQNDSVLTQNNIFPHFSNRENAYVFPLQQVFSYASREADEYTNYLFIKSDYVLIDLQYDDDWGRFLLTKIRQHARNFTLLEYEDGIYLYRKQEI